MDETHVLLIAVGIAVLMMSMGGGDKDEKEVIVIEDDPGFGDDWPMFDADQFKKKYKDPTEQEESGFQYSVLGRLRVLHDKVAEWHNTGNQIAIEVEHNVSLLDVDLRNAAMNAKLSKDGQSVENFRFVFERQTNQLTGSATDAVRRWHVQRWS